MEISVRSPGSTGKNPRAAWAAGVKTRSISALSIDLGHRGVEGDEKFIRMALREDQRRPDLYDIPERAGIARQESLVLETVDDVDRLADIGCPGGIRLGDLNADKKPLAPHIGDRGEAGLALAQRRLQRRSHLGDILP